MLAITVSSFCGGPVFKKNVQAKGPASISEPVGTFCSAPPKQKGTDSPALPVQNAATPTLPLGIVRDKPVKGRFVKTAQGYMVPYTATIPGTKVTFEMIPVPGGTFKLGSPTTEKGRDTYEGPQVAIAVEPFWIAKCEVTWGEFHVYMELYESLKEFENFRSILNVDKNFFNGMTELKKKKIKERILTMQVKLRDNLKDYLVLREHVEAKVKEVDAITVPSPIYLPELHYSSGEESNLPACTMTHYSAKQYTKWLSGVSGEEYRLPTEIEWEYAARAGTTTTYSFGDSPETLGDYAWYFENANEKAQAVGKKKPNPWGIHDMHGNVAEWVLDQFDKDAYTNLAKQKKETTVLQRTVWPKKERPCVLRGGSWDDDAGFCRSAKRIRSGADWLKGDWKEIDPMIYKSPWWFTNQVTTQVGFRIIRQLKPMSLLDKKLVWNTKVARTQKAVKEQFLSGHTVQGIANKNLPKAIKELEAFDKEHEDD